MKRYWLAFILTLSICGSALADTTPLKSYQAGDWKVIIKSANSAPMAIHFWGVTCPACVKEMPQWGQFVKNNPNAKIVFIQVDDVSMDSIKKMLSKAGLDKANNYYIAAPFDERLRYEIDPQWHGETPTTIVIDKSGKAIRKTGLVDFQKLQSALIVKS
ncbi:thioredoxin-like domain-containing protein [Polynucleobacter sp. MWH-Braz-FAM2G]|uniref:TlpA family protein disulfide reductase n=1 Tax=Polynucleobacter sp. MWH-Braz-FAM2G TaxID=1855883 RepID=UPI001BFD0E0B|nr:thioredoxin-like domain-containing protein [Polynucleobacter sp. MWH-Braz-FAM2G]QWD90100.1 redoxin domain-containing protein [Polynucleobacter sp. MWH-Braz-FAM2G]